MINRRQKGRAPNCRRRVRATRVLLNSSTGVYATIAVPGATSTRITGINPVGGTVAGVTDVITPQSGPLPVQVGFLYDYGSSAPAFTSFFLPATTSVTSMSVNDPGEIAFTYTAARGLTHGCLSNGLTFSTADEPNGAGATDLSDVNNGGQFVGWFTDKQGKTHGFIATPEPSPAVLWLSRLLALGLACWRGAKRRMRVAAG